MHITPAAPSRTSGSRTLHALVIATALAATASCTTAAAGPVHPGDTRRAHVQGSRVDIPVEGGTARIDTTSLRVTADTADGDTLQLSAPAATRHGRPGRVTATARGARWSYPDSGLTVTAAADHGRLRVGVRARADTTLDWPVTGTDPAVSAVQFPRGEGLSVPVADTWWNSPEAQLADSEVAMDSGLTMPLWGHTIGDHGVSYLTPTDIGTALRFTSHDGRLRSTATHRFSGGEETSDYTVTFALTDGSPVAPAVDYRDWLSEHGELGSLRRKFKENPAAKKLLGAFHAYTWGDGRKEAGIERLRRLGVSRMWLGYDADDQPMDAAAVSAAKKAGYLVGPYDSFANGQDPKTSDAPTSSWPAPVHPDFCVRGADGKPAAGFHDRGCYLSSQAFEQAEPERHYLADRADAMTANGADSYFLDVDAAGELFRDHSAAHPMTRARDRANRLARMKRLSADRKLVLGSESAGAWANGVLAFNHGSGTPVADGLWPLERDKDAWGGYAPAKAPAIFFKPARLTDAVAKAMYDPAYRVPLYETALHGSVVNVERWELPYDKLPEQKTTRALLAMLYNTPLNFVLDGPSLRQRGGELAALQKYFAPLHKAAGSERMTSFRRLSADHRVQRTVFGDGTLTVTANFGTAEHAGLPGGCVDAKLRGDHNARRLCPSTVAG
ncbi:glycoside hydrolase [Streptomyces sp. H27-D2]|uniref:glycoside hydrolase n=1 Tax=Streptomyces sp. H27-D2 TaxID=3046304 RepID=UPI002DB5A68C|nr:glycoside hydrolase [Streptomyces sp. H27-D2]MEC4019583.1 glycoside hydrolase [Streptomyces sp. H27-D2]